MKYWALHRYRDAQHIADALHVGTTVTSVNLSHNAIGDADAQRLSEALSVNNHVSSIDLDCNNLGAAAYRGTAAQRRHDIDQARE